MPRRSVLRPRTDPSYPAVDTGAATSTPALTRAETNARCRTPALLSTSSDKASDRGIASLFRGLLDVVEEAAQRLGEDLRLLGVHPVTGVLDPHQPGRREEGVHSRTVLGQHVVGVRAGDPEDGAVVARAGGRLRKAAQSLQVAFQQV